MWFFENLYHKSSISFEFGMSLAKLHHEIWHRRDPLYWNRLNYPPLLATVQELFQTVEQIYTSQQDVGWVIDSMSVCVFFWLTNEYLANLSGTR